MRLKYTQLACAATAIAILSACTRQNVVAFAEAGDGVLAVLSHPVCGDSAQTKALSNDFSFSFAQGDQVNVFEKGAYSTYMTYSLLPDGNDGSSADFQTENFSMKDGNYVSLYPSQSVTAGSSSVSLSFAGQNQTANGSTAHLSAYDYSWAEAEISNCVGEFEYSHKVAWLKIATTTLKDETFKSITVSADEGVAGSATLDLSTGVVTPARTAGDVLTMTLGGEDGINVSAGGTLTAFITIPAGNYSNMQVEVTGDAGTRYSYLVSSAGARTITAGYFYTAAIQVSDENFLNSSKYGVYDKVFTSEPTSEFVYDNETSRQISSGGSSSYTEFKILDLSSGEYVIIRLNVSSSSIAKGGAYSASVNINGTVTEPTLTVAKKDGNCVWLEDLSGTSGYIISI